MKTIIKTAVVCAAVAGGSISQAALVNLYTFNDGTTADHVGATSGVLVGSSSVSGGALQLAGAAVNSGYMSLPAGQLSAASSGGVSGQSSIGVWAQAASLANWASLASYGEGPLGENVNTNNWIALTPQHGAGGATIRLATKGAAVENIVDHTSPLSTTSMQHLVATFDQIGGTISLYVDGVPSGSTPITNGLDINTFTDTANSLGQSQWADPAFTGTVDEFAVYDSALSAGEVAAAFAAGPIPVPEPSSLVLLGLGFGLVARRRRK